MVNDYFSPVCRWNLQITCMKAFNRFQVFVYMVQNLQGILNVLLCAHSMLRAYTPLILQHFSTSRYRSSYGSQSCRFPVLPSCSNLSFFCDFSFHCYVSYFQHGVAIRSGHHCAQPLHRYLGISASARASLYFYNTKEDVDNFIQALNDTVVFFNSFK